MQSWIVSTSFHAPLEIILICWFYAQEILLLSSDLYFNVFKFFGQNGYIFQDSLLNKVLK